MRFRVPAAAVAMAVAVPANAQTNAFRTVTFDVGTGADFQNVWVPNGASNLTFTGDVDNETLTSVFFDFGGQQFYLIQISNGLPFYMSSQIRRLDYTSAALINLTVYGLTDPDPITSQLAASGVFQTTTLNTPPFRYIELRSSQPFAIDNVIISGGVPEPATWAVMLLGFGAIGAAMRRRHKLYPRVSFQAITG